MSADDSQFPLASPVEDRSSPEESAGTRGRPPKPPSEKRSKRKTVRFTPAELRRVEALAERADLSVAAFLRGAALGKHVKEGAGREARRAARAQLRRIGSRLKRIDQRSSGAVPEPVIAALRGVISDLK